MAELRFVTSATPVQAAASLLGAGLCERDGTRLAIAGGSVVAALPMARIDWSRVRLTWVDERRVPFAHPDSNRGAAYRSGALDRMAPPGLELPLYLDGETAEQACARVGEELAMRFGGGLDVLLLGLGEDGHIASLFPGRAPSSAIVQAVDDSPKPPAQRVTLTLAILKTAKLAILLASGESKRQALERLANNDASLPACALENLVVVTDLRLG